MRYLTIFVFALALSLVALNTEGNIKTTRDRQADLQEEYRHINDGYFDGNLPRDTVIRFTDDIPIPEKVMGLTDVEGDHFAIYISPKYNVSTDTAFETEMHEMCHIATFQDDVFDDHGPKWQQCMLNLAERGVFSSIW